AKKGFAGKILSSPFLRTSETANIIAQQLDNRFYPEPSLRERNTENISDFKETTLPEMRQNFNCLAVDASLETPWFPNVGAIERETDKEGTQRVKPLVDEYEDGDIDVLLVCHNISAKSAIRAL